MSKDKKTDSRMIEIMKSLDNSKENFKESVDNTDKAKILKEEKRLRELAIGHTNVDFKNENYYVAGSYNTGGQGKTVNSFIDSYQDTAINSTPKSQPTALRADEALEICIKRTIKSGKPINNISFYDEVNHNLMNLGFPSADSMTIKTQIIEMLGD